ncbi:MAG: hypothetical protein QM817_28920 [Archangium sp.]
MAFSERIERELDFLCNACGTARRATLTGIGHGRSAKQAIGNAQLSLEEVQVFLRCPACGWRPLARGVRHLVKQLWMAPVLLGGFLAFPVVLLSRPDDTNGHTVALVFLTFLGLLTVGCVSLVTYNVRRAQQRQVRWH